MSAEAGGKSSAASAAALVDAGAPSASGGARFALGSDNKLAPRQRLNSSGTGATAVATALAFSFAESTCYDLHFENHRREAEGLLFVRSA